MGWHEVVALIPGVLALLGLIFGWGVTWGSIRSKVNEISKKVEKVDTLSVEVGRLSGIVEKVDTLSVEVGRLSGIVETLGEIFIRTLVSRYPGTGLWEESNPRKLGKRGKEILSPIKEEIDSICRSGVLSPVEVMHRLGVRRLSRLAEEKGVSLEEVIVALGVYLEQRREEEG